MSSPAQPCPRQAGASFREMFEQGFNPPEAYKDRQYVVSWHGVGMHGQWPTVAARGHFEISGYDGELPPGMTICVESYVRERGDPFGVNLHPGEHGPFDAGCPVDERHGDKPCRL